MPEGLTAAAILLVAGPLIGLLGFYDTGLYRIWGAPREEHMATVAAHLRGWRALNAGFVVATILTTAGLAVLAGSVPAEAGASAILVTATIAYAIAGAMWCAVLAIRVRTTPALAALIAAGAPTEPAEGLLGAAIGGLFAAYALTTGAALLGIGVASLAGAVVATPIAALVAVAGVLVMLWYLRTGDVIPAVLYVPTLILGVALLGGWR